jgi:hypothetical protein
MNIIFMVIEWDLLYGNGMLDGVKITKEGARSLRVHLDTPANRTQDEYFWQCPY